MAATTIRERRPRAYISLAEIPTALRKLTRRLDELRNLEGPKPDTDFVGLSRLIADGINRMIEEVFGDDTAEARRFQVDRLSFLTNVPSKRVEEFCRGRDRAIAVIEAAIEWLKEKLADAEEDATGKTLRARHPNSSLCPRKWPPICALMSSNSGHALDVTASAVPCHPTILPMKALAAQSH